MGRKIRLFSPLAPVALAEKLKVEMDRPSTAAERKSDRVKGSGTEMQMRLWVKRSGKRTIPGPLLIADMTAQDGGTLIDGKIGLPKFAGCFGALWFLLLGFVLLLARIIVSVGDYQAGVLIVMVLSFPVLLLVVGFWTFVRMRKSVPEDEEKILQFLRSFAETRPPA